MVEKQHPNDVWEGDNDLGSAVPGWSPELGTRLSTVYSDIGTIKKASSLVGNNSEQLAKWRDGKARLPFHAAVILCEAAGRSLDWLVYGKDPSNANAAPSDVPDVDVFGDVVEAVAQALAEQEKRLSPKDLGRLCMLCYQLVTDSAGAIEPKTVALRLVSSR